MPCAKMEKSYDIQLYDDDFIGTTYSDVRGGCIMCNSLWTVKYIYLKQDRCKFALKGNQLTISLLSFSLHLLHCRYQHRILMQQAL